MSASRLRYLLRPLVAVAWLSVCHAADSVVTTPLRNAVRGKADEALDRRLQDYESLKTAGGITAWQKTLRDRFIGSLGGFPDQRCPLNARVVSRLDRDGYSIENVIYDSFRNYPVTANLYLPKVRPPFPAVLVPCGHTENGKAADSYQRVCILLAKNGIAALIYDPPGQGERKQILKTNADGVTGPLSRFKPTSEHMAAGVAPILLGRNLATYMIWDGIRSLDYLQSREEIDADAIGCTGSSGGGNLTSFLMALDDRIVCAAPGNFITTTRIKNVRPGPGDAEQNIFGQTAYGLDHPDFLLLRAPRPTLILSATRDFVPIEGTWTAFRQAKRIFTRLGYSERVGLVETDDRHGFNSELRVAMVRWMRRWLLHRDDVVTENTNQETLPEERLRCTPQGQVLMDRAARSLFDLYRDEADRAAEIRRVKLHNRNPREQRDLVRTAIGLRSLSDLPQLRVEQCESQTGDPPGSQRYLQTLLRGVPTVILVFHPQMPSGRSVILVSDQGKNDSALAGSIPAHLDQGTTVLTVDLAGYGETEMKSWRYGSMSGVLGPNSAEYYILYMLGDSFVRIRTEELLQCSRFIREILKLKGAVSLEARGGASIPALHCLACEPGAFSKGRCEGGLTSWDDVARTVVTRRQLCNTVHGVLQNYDLPDLRRMIGSQRLTVINPVDATGARDQ